MAWLGRFDDFNGVNMGTVESVKNAKMQSARSSSTTGTNSSISQYLSTSVSKQIKTNVSPGNGQSGYCKIGDITNKVHIAAIVGIIIGKESPKSVISKKGNGTERHLLSLTVCDEPLSFINVTCWGSSEFINNLATEITIGDVVDIRGANVQIKSNSSIDDKFKPWTPGPCHLNITDSQGHLVPYAGSNASEYANLLHVPTRAHNDFYTLEDIEANGMSLQGEHINILAVLKKIWPVRDIKTKNGKKTRKVDIVVCDETCQSFHLTLWDSFVCLVETWAQFETADVRISFSEFHSSMVASTSSKTILTVDPDTPEAHSLRQFVINQSPDYMSTESTDIKDPDPESIRNILTVNDVKALQRDVCSTGQPGYGVLYAILSHFDVDGDMKAVLKDVWCRKRVYESSGYICTNSSCVGSDLSNEDLIHVEYSATVSLTDHTGSLEYCNLLSSVAERILGYQAPAFKCLATSDKTHIKWDYLLERMKAVLKIKRTENRTDGRCYVQILALEKVSPAQFTEQAAFPNY